MSRSHGQPPTIVSLTKVVCMWGLMAKVAMVRLQILLESLVLPLQFVEPFSHNFGQSTPHKAFRQTAERPSPDSTGHIRLTPSAALMGAVRS